MDNTQSNTNCMYIVDKSNENRNTMESSLGLNKTFNEYTALS